MVDRYQILPDLTTDEYAALKADIAARGVQVPIEYDEAGDVLDGHHRVRICLELRAEGADVPDWPRLIRAGLSEDEKLEHALTLNLARRHLTAAQRKDAAQVLRARGWTYQRISTLLGVSLKTAHRDGPTALSNDKADLPARLTGADGKSYPATYQPRRPRTAIATGEREARRTAAALADMPDADAEQRSVWTLHDLRRAARRQGQTDRGRELGMSAAGLPTGPFQVIYADPPWRYEHAVSDSRAVENHYPTMDLETICALDIAGIAADAAVLFLWATNPKLDEALRVITAWGFSYRTNLVWVKDSIGMGYYARARHELLLVARRGDFPPPAEANRPDSVITAPRTAHSAKPEAAAAAIERMYPRNTRLELFARSARPGWVTWGNELGRVIA